MVVVGKIVYGNREVRPLKRERVDKAKLLAWSISRLKEAGIEVEDAPYMAVVKEETVYIVRGDAVFG